MKLISIYLCERFQYVQINETSSSKKLIEFDVPQGFVLGPILFNLYVSDMQNLIKSNICQHANDTTFYEHFRASEMDQYVTKLEPIMSDMMLKIRT